MSKSHKNRPLHLLQNTGLAMFIGALALFTLSVFLGSFQTDQSMVDRWISDSGITSETFRSAATTELTDKSFNFAWQMTSAVKKVVQSSNQHHQTLQEWDKVIWASPQELALTLEKQSAQGVLAKNKGIFFLLTFLLGFIGVLLYVLPDAVLLGKPGIKNNHIYHRSATNRGLIGWIAFGYLVGFYLLLYFSPAWIVNWTLIADPMSNLLSGKAASQWFVYGLLYTTTMTAMGVRMYVKYRNNIYQIVRTTSVVFFQVIFAFLLVEILPLFQLPAVDLKNAWPLDYSFLFDWRVGNLLEAGNAGKFIFFWGIVLTVILVPTFTYFYGKRWYCSWVCGCGGLAETLGDPFRQHSDKSVKAWKYERFMIHGVLVFAAVMTVWTGWHTYNVINLTAEGEAEHMLLGVSAFDIRQCYGLLIGSWFSGVIGTGFYPIFGNRVWCRFGCPLAAYMGIVQRFKSRFRITTNGGQCISCGNCSTYCEMGIDVRAYAQRGQNVVRASCVGCGVCAAVCPRGVLKLENGPEEARINDNPILIGKEGARIAPFAEN